MAIPDFQSLMLPLLRLLADGQEHSSSEVVAELADQFRLTEAERTALLPSGQQVIFANRVGWAQTYMKKAGLLESPGRSRFKITQRGLQVLQNSPDQINIKFLQNYPEFREFQKKPPHTTIADGELPKQGSQTPEETLESGYQALREELARDLLERVMACSPRFFERLVVDLLVSMGYGGSRKDAGEAIGRGGDGGIDGIIKEDKLGLDVVYIQAKRWSTTVGRPIVQAFAGSLEGQRARKGVLITTSQFSADAWDYVGRIEKKIVLIDGDRLAQFMIDHGVGVTEVVRYVVKKVDLDYFSGGE